MQLIPPPLFLFLQVAQHTADDVSLLWLEDPTQAAKAAVVLMANATALGIVAAYHGADLQVSERGARMGEGRCCWRSASLVVTPVGADTCG